MIPREDRHYEGSMLNEKCAVMDDLARRFCIRENGCVAGAATAVWISIKRKPIEPTTVFIPNALETTVWLAIWKLGRYRAERSLVTSAVRSQHKAVLDSNAR